MVISKTLTHADGPESRIASGELVDDIERFKREPGGVIVAHGGGTFIGSLIRENLVDEYRLVIHPVVTGNGTGLFGLLRELRRLDLVEARTFPSGTVIHAYRPHEGIR